MGSPSSSSALPLPLAAVLFTSSSALESEGEMNQGVDLRRLSSEVGKRSSKEFKDVGKGRPTTLRFQRHNSRHGLKDLERGSWGGRNSIPVKAGTGGLEL